MYPTRHALLRDRRSWRTPAWATKLQGLIADDDGFLSLQRLPKPLVPVQLPPPYEVEASGLAAAPCMGLFVADTAHDRVLFRDDFCCDEARIGPVPCACADGAGFAAPRGLAYGAHGLFVADSAHARILRYRVETLRLQGSMHGASTMPGFTMPYGVAIDARGRVYVLDAASQKVSRYEANGAADTAYTTALATHLSKPRFLALAADAVLWVSDADGDRVHRFDEDGAALAPVPAASADWLPRAIAISGNRSYIADASSGLIFAYDGDDCLGSVPGYRGPVSALACGDDGALYIKPGQDDRVIVACAGQGVVASGERVPVRSMRANAAIGSGSRSKSILPQVQRPNWRYFSLILLRRIPPTTNGSSRRRPMCCCRRWRAAFRPRREAAAICGCAFACVRPGMAAARDCAKCTQRPPTKTIDNGCRRYSPSTTQTRRCSDCWRWHAPRSAAPKR